MNRQVTRIYNRNGAPNDYNCIATVVQVEDGEAVMIAGLPGRMEPVEVTGHFSEVPPVRPGDRVAVMLTSGGPIVMARLRGRGEGPRPVYRDEDGRIIIHAEKGMRIQFQETRIELTEDGSIKVNGKEIHRGASWTSQRKGVVVELV